MLLMPYTSPSEPHICEWWIFSGRSTSFHKSLVYPMSLHLTLFFLFPICKLEVIKYWRQRRPGNEATSVCHSTKCVNISFLKRSTVSFIFLTWTSMQDLSCAADIEVIFLYFTILILICSCCYEEEAKNNSCWSHLGSMTVLFCAIIVDHSLYNLDLMNICKLPPRPMM